MPKFVNLSARPISGAVENHKIFVRQQSTEGKIKPRDRVAALMCGHPPNLPGGLGAVMLRTGPWALHREKMLRQPEVC